MLQFYYHPSPNPTKVALYLEEVGLPYEVVPIDTRKGAQFTPEFTALNPNAKVPVIVDGDVTVFDSNAILLYLAGKTGRFMPPDTPAQRGAMLSWMMFSATGLGPYCGQAVHFKHFAPEPKAYAETRYLHEAERHFKVLDGQLARHRYVLGDAYTVVDMTMWGWSRMVPFILGEGAWSGLPNVKRLLDEINARPAAARAEALKTRHEFKTVMDDEARSHMFKHLAKQAA